MKVALFAALLCLLPIFTQGQQTNFTLDDAFAKCRNAKKHDVGTCIVNLINEDLQPLIAQGIPELGLDGERLDNYNFTFDDAQASNFLKAGYTNGYFRGFNLDFRLQHLKIDYDKKLAAWSAFAPSFTFYANCFVNASLLLVNLQGEGPCWWNIHNATYTGITKLAVEEIDGDLRLQEESTDFGFNIKNPTFRMKNLFQGNELVEGVAWLFLDENIDAMLALMRDDTRRFFRELTGNIVNRVLAKIPIKKLAGYQYLKEAFNIH